MTPLRWGAGALALVVCVVWVRVWTSARAELADAERARTEGRVEEAIRHYQYALRWYSPLASAPADAAEGLRSMAVELESRGDAANALRAWRRLRGGVLATRSLYTPFPDALPEANRNIARLMAAEQLALGQPTIRGRSLAQLEADHLALLELDPTPAAGWSLAVVLGFFGWVLGGFLVVFRGFDREARRTPELARWAALTAACFAVWLVGLWRA